jgi:CAAX prenyl protease-like protein
LAFALWMALRQTPPAIAQGTGFVPPAPYKPGSFPGLWLGLWMVCRIIGGVVTVPLAEELAFRGYLTRRLIASDFDTQPVGAFSWVSFLASSVLFGLLHGEWLAGTMAGMIFAVALYRRRELTYALIAHATTNALIALTVLTTGQ